MATIHKQIKSFVCRNKENGIIYGGTRFFNGVKDELNCSFTINDLYFICSLFMGHGVRPFVNLATHSQQIMETTKQFIQDMSTLVEGFGAR